VRKCERNNSADTMVSEERGGGDASTRAEFPLWRVNQTMLEQVVLLQPMEVHNGEDIHLHPMKDPTLELVDMP